jgi:hypothetical protein
MFPERVVLAMAALLLFECLAAPEAESAGRAFKNRQPSPGVSPMITLSIRIAEARRDEKKARLYRSIARRQKSKSLHVR